MAITHLLEDFSSHTLARIAQVVTEDALADERLNAFENGYRAGWDDASSAHRSEQGRISAEFAKNLRSLSFTYNEAYTHVIAALQPLFEQMIESVLPHLAQLTLGQRILLETRAMAGDYARPEMEFTLSSASRAKIEAIMETDATIPIRFVTDDSLADGQVFLKLGQTERIVDPNRMLKEMDVLVTSFFNNLSEEKLNG